MFQIFSMTRWLGRARTLQGPKLHYLWNQCSDEAPACVETVQAMEERFCFVLVVLIYLPDLQNTQKCKIDDFVKY